MRTGFSRNDGPPSSENVRLRQWQLPLPAQAIRQARKPWIFMAQGPVFLRNYTYRECHGVPLMADAGAIENQRVLLSRRLLRPDAAGGLDFYGLLESRYAVTDVPDGTTNRPSPAAIP